jgi:hypothetical protein
MSDEEMDVAYCKDRYNELEPGPEKDDMRRVLVGYGVKFNRATGEAE